jgi:hypothetical protein
LWLEVPADAHGLITDFRFGWRGLRTGPGSPQGVAAVDDENLAGDEG